MTPRRAAMLAALVYLAVAVWCLRAVLPAPGRDLPVPKVTEQHPFDYQLDRADGEMVAASIAHMARTLPVRPWRAYESGACWPLAQPVTLGEHMIGAGVLGILPQAAGHNPILTFNVVALLHLWIAALAMYALVWHWTRSTGAAFVGGLLFGFDPRRVVDVIHLFVRGDRWTPLVLLFLDRLFQHGRWLDAIALAAFLDLQLLESIYPVVAMALILVVYGGYLLARYARRLPALAPKLLAVGACAATLGSFVFRPYLHTRSTWGVLEGRSPLLYPPAAFAPGGAAYPGFVLLLFAAVALLDRLRGARRNRGYDPRLVLLAAGFAVFWTVIWWIPVPWLGLTLPSLFVLGRLYELPGLTAARALAAAACGVQLVGAFLAAYGVSLLLPRRPAAARSVVVLALSLATLAEVLFCPRAGGPGFTVAQTAVRSRPSQALQKLLGELPDGAVVDIPWNRWPSYTGHEVLLSAFHHHPVAACYNSFTTPLQDDVARLAASLPAPTAIAELHALGFRSVVIHLEYVSPAWYRRLRDFRPRVRGRRLSAGRLTLIGAADRHVALRIESPALVTSALWPLTAAPLDLPDPAVVAPPSARIDFRFRAVGAVYRHPDPIEPTALSARWTDASGRAVAHTPVRMLLPVALAPTDTATRQVDLPVPVSPGTYRLLLAATPTGKPLAWRTVQVEPPGRPRA